MADTGDDPEDYNADTYHADGPVADVQWLVDLSERHEMSRHMVVSPENADRLDRDQLERATERTLRDTLGDRDGVDYAFAVHMEGGDRPHAHVVATGRANQRGDPLWMDERDFDNIRDREKDRDRGYGLW